MPVEASGVLGSLGGIANWRATLQKPAGRS
jgi:hypothetical protein